MKIDPFLTAVGLTVWLGLLAAATFYVRWRMRFPKSMFPSDADAPLATRVIGAVVGLAGAAYYAFSAPSIVLFFDVVVSALVPYFLVAYTVALTVERRRAKRLGLPEPGTSGTSSGAEAVVLLAMAGLFAVAATVATIYGIENQLGGNGGEGLAGLVLGAIGWVMALVAGLFGLLSLWVLRYPR